MIEATYRRGEIHLMMSQPDEALRTWKDLVGMKPKSNPFRLQGLIKMGEEYEKREEYKKAVSIYEDLAAHSTDKRVAAAARQRAAGLRKAMKSGGAPPKGKSSGRSLSSRPV